MMEITTKYDLLSSVWAMNENKPNEYIICKITSEISEIDKPASTIYYVKGRNMYFMEEELYPTKEELLQSL